MSIFRHFIPTEIIYGAGSLAELKTVALPGKKALVVCGGNSLKRLGIIDDVLSILKARGIETVLFDSIIPNPVVKDVMSAASLAKEEQCDFVLGLGGGSSVDSAKAIAMMATNPGTYWDYIQVGSGGKKPFSAKGLPVVAIPTTAGTGTEVNPTSVITNPETGEKVGSACEFPVLAIVDPELTLNITPRYTAFQGFDVLFHCIEAFISVKAAPMTDAMALEGIRLVFKSLPTAVNNGSDLAARSDVSVASTLAGMIICISSCTTAHLIEHSLSGMEPSLPHGEGLILFSKAFHGYAAKFIPERYARIADVIGVSKPGQSDTEKARLFLEALEALKIACNVDQLRLSDHGFEESDIDKIVAGTHYIAGGAFTRDRYEISDEALAEMIRVSL